MCYGRKRRAQPDTGIEPEFHVERSSDSELTFLLTANAGWLTNKVFWVDPTDHGYPTGVWYFKVKPGLPFRQTLATAARALARRYLEGRLPAYRTKAPSWYMIMDSFRPMDWYPYGLFPVYIAYGEHVHVHWHGLILHRRTQRRATHVHH